jgi:osmotically-inducible protein OsmY
VRRTFDDVQVSPLRDSDKRESDENIAFSLQRSLADEPRVSIDVVEGVVTLRGTANASPEQIERIAARTPGVTSVVNELGETAPSTSLVQ